MKKLLLTFFATASLLSARADEGMWIPMLIGKNYEEMQRLGLKLSQEDLYSINHSSLKDAIIQFNGGCTGEMISGSGLLLTNHHCGYDAITTLSTVDKNHLDNGFWAYSHAEELPAKNLHVLFLENIEDVTEEVLKATGKSTGEKFDKKYEAIRKKIEERASGDKKYVAQLKEYFSGNQYLVLTYRKYTDIRLAGTPPKSLGKYGGDTDNWIWPRHTADFSLFRVYADKNNEPADYSADNVPYKPKKSLPISIRGVQENDYAMILGYPGRTNRYEVSYGVDLAVKDVNLSIVNLRAQRLAIMKRQMNQDKAVYLKLTSSYSRTSNYWKYYIGQTEQLKRLKVVSQKSAEEQVFSKWANKNAKEYNNLMSEYAAAYAAYKPYAKHIVYYHEGFRSTGLARLATVTEPLLTALEKKNPDQDTVDKHIKSLTTARTAMMKEFHAATDQEILAEMTKMYFNDVPRNQLPAIYQEVIFKQFGGDNADKTFSDYAASLYKSTFLLDDERFAAFVKAPSADLLNNDPAVQYALSFVKNYDKFYQPKSEEFSAKKRELSKRYVRGLMEMKSDKLFYPDANSTMRISYGQVKSYAPKDAVEYNYFTTMEGLMAKYKAGDDEFDLPKELIDLYKRKDYGRYMSSDSTLHINFISTNDITGGNSGSPVINARGELIGCAFDGNWEAMSGDIAFDKQYKRTISVDIRYVLFVIDKMGKAQNLLEEMQINN